MKYGETRDVHDRDCALPSSQSPEFGFCITCDDSNNSTDNIAKGEVNVDVVMTFNEKT